MRKVSRRPELEPLEDRVTPARIVVHALADGASMPIPASHVAPNLRSAIDHSAAGDEIDLDGGVYTLSSELFVTHNLTIRNAAGGTSTINAGQHGRVFEIVTGTNVSLSGLTITGGRDPNQGGGIRNLGTLTVTNCTITGNFTFGGGGILNAGTLTLSGSTVSGNTASGNGGGIFNVGTLTVTTSTVAGNTAPSGNGGGVLNTATLTVSASTFSGNSANVSGGGLYNAGTLSLADSTLAGNTGGVFGGGVYTAGTALLVNDTVTRNTARFGGGLALGSPFATGRVWNTLVALNTATTGPDVYGTVVSLGHNLIGNTAGATGFSTAKGDLLNVPAASVGLGPLASNGGPTQTVRLLPGSAAIDRGDDAVLTSSLLRLTTDQRGNPRRVGAHVDVGAYEAP
ncbi:MAG TPA: choice-of-anchor Q domain-containing protein [Gemmataceae bacterium]|nr:choice-of-anchor Q domain-containing protein [Gemmataceae bacterium]